MELKESLSTLKKNKIFKEWNLKNKDNFFSYALKITDPNGEQPWQLGFYNKSKDKIATFVVDDAISLIGEEEVFKKQDMEVNPIKLEKVELSFDDILSKAKDFQKEKYPNELLNKTIAILQRLEKYGTVWNITFLMHSFRTLNIKASPENGKILDHNLDSLMDFVKK